MKKAALILAHNNFKQLDRLLGSLKSEDFDVFVHIDKKAKDFNVNSFFNRRGVTFIKNRKSVSLDTWTLFQATMNLVNEALRKGTKYSYYMLLSASDYPIKPITYISEFLDNNYPQSFIDVTPINRSNWVWKKFNHFRWIHINNLINSYVKSAIAKKVLKIPIRLSERIMDVLGNVPYKKTKYSLYGGSAWRVISDVAMKYIADEYNRNRKDIRNLSHSITPEETFFQTMIMNSPYGKDLLVNPIDQREQNCLTYAYFTDDYSGNGKKPFNGHPYIFTIDDFQMLKNMDDRMFARKFDQNVDSEILDKIDSELLQRM